MSIGDGLTDQWRSIVDAKLDSSFTITDAITPPKLCYGTTVFTTAWRVGFTGKESPADEYNVNNRHDQHRNAADEKLKNPKPS